MPEIKAQTAQESSWVLLDVSLEFSSAVMSSISFERLKV